MERTKIEKLKKRIEELENHIFIIDMVDHWTSKQSDMYDELQEKLTKAKLLLTKELLKDIK